MYLLLSLPAAAEKWCARMREQSRSAPRPTVDSNTRPRRCQSSRILSGLVALAHAVNIVVSLFDVLQETLIMDRTSSHAPKATLSHNGPPASRAHPTPDGRTTGCFSDRICIWMFAGRSVGRTHSEHRTCADIRLHYNVLPHPERASSCHGVMHVVMVWSCCEIMYHVAP